MTQPLAGPRPFLPAAHLTGGASVLPDEMMVAGSAATLAGMVGWLLGSARGARWGILPGQTKVNLITLESKLHLG